MSYYKNFTHDLCSPIQPGKPVWDGVCPFTLPTVTCDESAEECAAGWNACRDVATALQIGGIWRSGFPSRLFAISQNGYPVIERKDKVRSASWIVERELSSAEIEAGIHELSKVFAPHSDLIAKEQILWRRALARPNFDIEAVELGLEAALETRGLKWEIKQYPNEKAAWNARAARAARDAWAAWAARAARAVWAVWDPRAARAACDAWDARDVRVARDALGALMVAFAAEQKWIQERGDLLTIGIRDAYVNGMQMGLPTGKDEFGYCMIVRSAQMRMPE